MIEKPCRRETMLERSSVPPMPTPDAFLRPGLEVRPKSRSGIRALLGAAICVALGRRSPGYGSVTRLVGHSKQRSRCSPDFSARPLAGSCSDPGAPHPQGWGRKAPSLQSSFSLLSGALSRASISLCFFRGICADRLFTGEVFICTIPPSVKPQTWSTRCPRKLRPSKTQ